MATTNEWLWKHPETSRFSKQVNLPLWILAVVFALTDILTTWIGVTYLGLHELNPFVAAMFTEMGVAGAMILLKVTFMAFAFVVSRVIHEERAFTVPLALVIVWGLGSFLNLILFALAL